jgi:hypothetical protein
VAPAPTLIGGDDHPVTERADITSAVARARRRVAESAPRSPEWCAAIEELEELEGAVPCTNGSTEAEPAATAA